MHDRLDPGQRVAAAQRLQRLAEIGDVRPQERDLGLGMRRYMRGHEIDAEHPMASLMQIADHHSPRLAAASGHRDRRHRAGGLPDCDGSRRLGGPSAARESVALPRSSRRLRTADRVR
jgi:hypothetical protein